jgi:hypothetical protein
MRFVLLLLVACQVEMGFRWQHVAPALATQVIDSVHVGHDDTVRARLRGEDLWWTSLR